jgi:phosphoribosylformylglycinamidine synthase
MAGLFDDVGLHLKQYFKFADALILMVRTTAPSLAASEYAALFGNDRDTLTPIDLPREGRLIDSLFEASRRRLIRSAHDVAEGGLAVAIAEACFNPDQLFGAEIRTGTRLVANLFGEGPSTVILSIEPEMLVDVQQTFSSLDVQLLGRVTAEPRLRISDGDGYIIDEDVRNLQRLYDEALIGRLNQ